MPARSASPPDPSLEGIVIGAARYLNELGESQAKTIVKLQAQMRRHHRHCPDDEWEMIALLLGELRVKAAADQVVRRQLVGLLSLARGDHGAGVG